MQDDAIQTARIHPGNRAELFTWQNFQPAYRDLGWKNQNLGTEPARPIIWTHRKFYKGFRGKARSWKPRPISPWVHMKNFSPVSEMAKCRISSPRVSARNAKFSIQEKTPLVSLALIHRKVTCEQRFFPAWIFALKKSFATLVSRERLC